MACHGEVVLRQRVCPGSQMPRRCSASALRSETALLQHGLSGRRAPPTAPLCQPSPPTKARRTKRPSRWAARLSVYAERKKCDGSAFRCDLLVGPYANVGCEISAGHGSSRLRRRFCALSAHPPKARSRNVNINSGSKPPSFIAVRIIASPESVFTSSRIRNLYSHRPGISIHMPRNTRPISGAGRRLLR
jgi:hypothetical protein